MLSEKFIVLRSREVSAPARGDMGKRTRRADPYALEASRPVVRLEEIDLTKRERNDMRRDPGTRAIALPMPMKLIAPVSSRPAAPGIQAWGIEAVRAHASHRRSASLPRPGR